MTPNREICKILFILFQLDLFLEEDQPCRALQDLVAIQAEVLMETGNKCYISLQHNFDSCKYMEYIFLNLIL